MYAMYDTIEKKYATVLNFPHFGRGLDWVDTIGPTVAGERSARIHRTKSTMKGQLTQLLWRLHMNVEMLKSGTWQKELDRGFCVDHNTHMLNWSIECKRRLDAGYGGFGMEIVEIKA